MANSLDETEPSRPSMKLVGIVVNPDAGLGGRIGLKGSDGKASLARQSGAEEWSGPRMTDALTSLLDDLPQGVSFIVPRGRMGSEWLPSEFPKCTMVEGADPSTAEDTVRVVREMVEMGVDIILYAGGDGTTRDIVTALMAAGRKDLPIIGVPGGVKMHSGCFASSPTTAAAVLTSWAAGELLDSTTEVMDLDEEAYSGGEWKVRLYAEATTPASPRWMQGAKQRVEASDEEDIIEGLAEHIGEMMTESENLLIIWGSGGTLRKMAGHLGIDKTVLGIDVIKGGEIVASDVNENDLLQLLDSHGGEALILLSPMGGQGFLIGRGNLQISPAVLRRVGLGGVLGIATPAKLLTLVSLRIDSGERELDEEFRKRKYIKVLQGYRTTRLVRVSED